MIILELIGILLLTIMTSLCVIDLIKSKSKLKEMNKKNEQLKLLLDSMKKINSY